MAIIDMIYQDYFSTGGVPLSAMTYTDNIDYIDYEDVLEGVPLEDIEKFLRKKKLERIKKLENEND